MNLRPRSVFLSARTVLTLCMACCDLPAIANAGTEGAAPESPTVSQQAPAEAIAPCKAPLATFQGELLDFAFDVATAIPIQPHIKDRSRAQEQVVAACLELNLRQRAQGYIERIDNWR